MSDSKDTKGMIQRPPVVVVMGHVDHGKTTLLDFIRKANVADREAGGITQAVGAYEIKHKGADGKEREITFIDTPGHEAFSSMRSRGAEVADLAILVVAADESVKPQTREAAKTLKDSKTPFVVAITKMDKPGADVEKVKNDLTAEEVLLEGYGGNISYQPLSAKSGEGVDELLDLILLAADLEGLEYDPKAPASGFILETRTNKNRGLEASVIVRNGILKRGENIATKTAKGKVKILENFLGKPVKELPAGSPALIVGLDILPQIGETFHAGKAAAEVAQTPMARPDVAPSAQPGEPKGLRLILKAGDAGSLEALSGIMKALPAEEPTVIIAESVGDIGENDVKFAVSGGAIIVGFKSRVDKAAQGMAQAQQVRVLTSDIVYELVSAVEELIKEAATPPPTGELEVLAVFSQQKLDKQVIGGKVVAGVFRNRAQFTVKRDDEVLGLGHVNNLQEQKKDASQVAEGNECGLMVGAAVEIKAGDRLLIEETA
jgi:translation initiation factor IF-2